MFKVIKDFSYKEKLYFCVNNHCDRLNTYLRWFIISLISIAGCFDGKCSFKLFSIRLRINGKGENLRYDNYRSINDYQQKQI